MFNPSAALFANTMLMFRLMFFHNKKPAEAGFIMLQCLFSGTSPVVSPYKPLSLLRSYPHGRDLTINALFKVFQIKFNCIPIYPWMHRHKFTLFNSNLSFPEENLIAHLVYCADVTFGY